MPGAYSSTRMQLQPILAAYFVSFARQSGLSYSSSQELPNCTHQNSFRFGKGVLE